MVQQKCANVEWIKPGGFQSIAVVGPDVIALHSCSYILFFPPDGPRIDYEASTKANGLGVQCLAGYVAAPLFAFAEKAATKPRLLVKSFPGFETISVLSDNKLGEFMFLEFSENECIVALKGLPSTQQLREFQTRIYGDQVLCYGRDGLVSLLSMKDGRVECTQVEHHWKNRGVKTGVLSKHGHIVSLGYSTTLICTRLKQRPSVEPKHDPPSPHAPSPPRALDVPFPLLAELEDKLSFHNLSWLEFKQNEKVNEDKIKYRTKLAELHRDFRIVQLKVQALLDKNITGPSEERLDLIEFDINAERKARALEAAQGACEAYRMTHEELIESWKHQRDLIRRLCWDAMKVKTRAVYGPSHPLDSVPSLKS
ncbi:uncharacterized protein LOC103522627 [Diaphorina citri]|uniref:Uncharacterized protein LOC103522627 n=1 Tax=Diaphorina citri TaxID=121845 RepID=A0A3Q0JJB1_DIACI|nr:uncharacterized protein LOC103522627 [Diaphorina citri]